jgi:hypothetical protein
VLTWESSMVPTRLVELGQTSGLRKSESDGRKEVAVTAALIRSTSKSIMNSMRPDQLPHPLGLLSGAI